MARRCLPRCSRTSERGSQTTFRTILLTEPPSFTFRPEHEMRSVNPVAFRQAASRFATGVAVLTALDERDEVCGMTANSFVTVSLFPPTVLVSVKRGRMHNAISANGRYGVNVLPEGGKGLSKHFSGRPPVDARLDCEIPGGLPRLSNCVAFFACEGTRVVDVSDHT